MMQSISLYLHPRGVDAGVVVYQGWRSAQDDRVVARRLALATPGVKGVWDARVPRREWQSLA